MISWAKVVELRDEIGREDFNEVAEMFMEDAADTVARLACDDALEANLHELKGAALTMGFSGLASLCQIGESAAARGDVDAVDLDAVATTFHESCAIFHREAAGRLDAAASRGAA